MDTKTERIRGIKAKALIISVVLFVEKNQFARLLDKLFWEPSLWRPLPRGD